MSAAKIQQVNNGAKGLSKTPCDGFGCYNNATEKINVNAGKFGIINVSVCSKCKYIIKEKEQLFSERLSLADPLSLKPTGDNHLHNVQSRGDSLNV